MSIRATVERILAPGYGTCGKCKRPWKYVQGHSTTYTEDGSRGCFPLCEECWESLFPDERLPYYKELYNRWASYGYPLEASWEQMRHAVLTEETNPIPFPRP